MCVVLAENEKKAYRAIGELAGLSPDGICFRLMIILLENGLMEPWMCAFNPCDAFRVG